jgi:hypothetical protein
MMLLELAGASALILGDKGSQSPLYADSFVLPAAPSGDWDWLAQPPQVVGAVDEDLLRQVLSLGRLAHMVQANRANKAPVLGH